MPGHTVVASFTSADQTEGCKVEDSILHEIWPNATPGEIVTGCRKALELGLWLNLVSAGQTMDNATALVNQGTPDTH